MSYKINFEAYSNNFSLPQSVVDDNFDALNPVYLKVILFIFKNSFKNYSVNLLANLLKTTEAEISDAIEYWVGKGLLFHDKQQRVKPEAIILPVTTPPLQANNSELSFLLSCMEQLLSRPITSVEHKTIVHILEFIKLPADVILMAIEYCVSVSKMNSRYLEKLCASWADKGITSHSLAEQYLTLLKQTKQRETHLKQMMGIENRALTDYESDAILRWINEYSYANEVIKLAFEKTVAATGKIAFPYMNKIMSNWHGQGFRTLEDITSADSAKPKRSGSYDIDELDRFWDNVPKLD